MLLIPANSVQASSRLAPAVLSRSWAWLFQIARRLDVDVYFIDVWGTPVLSAPDADASGLVREAEFLAAARRALRAESAELVRIGSRVAVCAGVRRAGVEVAVLALVRQAPESEWSGQFRQRLEQVATVLRAAAEAHLAADAPESNYDARRLTALRRALAEGDPQTDVGLVRVFAEAIAIWEDLEVCAYSRALNGDYIQQWAPPGAPDDRIPATLSLPPSLETRELTRLPGGSLEHLGMTWPTEVAAVRLSINGSSWLLVFAGALESAALSRVGSYVDILEQSLMRLLEADERGLFERIWRHVVGGDASAPSAAEAVLGEIRRAVGGDFAAMFVATGAGQRTLAIGDVAHFSDPHTPDGPVRMTAARPLPGGGMLTLAMGRSDAGPAFSTREQALVERAAGLLEPWAAAIARPARASDRRSTSRPFDQMVEDIAEQNSRRGVHVSVVVIRLAGDRVSPGVTHRLAAQIRAHLRAAEPAGALADGEIAAVLFDAKPDHADAFIARLRRLADQLADGAPLASAAVGIAHCTSGSRIEMPLIAAARQDALRREAGIASKVWIQ